MTIEQSLAGKCALVTGASSGLGEHFAKTLAKQGATVVLAARRLEKLKSLQSEIETAGGQAFAVTMDVTSADSVASAFAAIDTEFSAPCDILINNSGVGQASWFVDTTEEEWANIVDTNLTGVWRVAQQASKALIAAGNPGSIVNIASISGLRASTLRVAYGTSKAGVIALTQQQAVELGELGIRANAVCPGPVRTKLAMAVHTPEIIAAYHDAIPLNRYGTEDEIASVITFLCSPAASYVTGQTLAVDGGFEATGVGLPALRE